VLLDGIINLSTDSLMRSIALAFFLFAGIPAICGDLRINLPKRTKLTPVQQLNREGVNALKKHDIAKAEKYFYRAYLIDPDDPFTLNNLGYVSELKGQVERAQRFYELSARQDSETVIAKSSNSKLEGKRLTEITGSNAGRELRVNQGNVWAMSLLSQGRTEEAEEVLRRTLTVDPRNPFTLNNLGYTMEAEGDLESALQYYNSAANLRSSEKIVVAMDRRWRGKDISSVAESNARAVQRRLETEERVADRVARLNLQGVSALNRNDRQTARKLFHQAYRLDPENAFALNNMGYLAELDDDQESADDFYTRAKLASGANERVSLANRREMQGLPLAQVAASNDEGAESNLEAQRQQRIRQGGPIQLKTRDNRPVIEPAPITAEPTQTNPPGSQPPPQ
jgi:Flp pilus assembly protein TadD